MILVEVNSKLHNKIKNKYILIKLNKSKSKTIERIEGEIFITDANHLSDAEVNNP